MEKQVYAITFQGVSDEIASLYMGELREALLDAAPDIVVDHRRADTNTQDFGATLVLILGTPAAIAAAKAIGDWLQKRHSAVIDINQETGHVHAEGITSRDALRIAEMFQPRG